jgi:hypothetical protein
MRRLVIIVLTLSFAVRTQAQPSNDSSHIDPLRTGIVAGATVGGFVVGHGMLNNLWWKGERVPFHINTQQDYDYALNADKYGHATFAYMTSTVYGDLLRWCGLDSASAAWWGFGVAMTYQTYIEVRDGFSRDYGFSWGDIGANTLGAALPLAKHYIPALRPFDLQISFWPSPAFRQGAYNAIIDDYTSTTHWLAMNVHDLSPRAWRDYLPPWLGVAVGHSVRNLDGRGGGEHVVVLSLDWQLHRIPNLPPWLRDVARVLHLYHLPAPAIQILPNVVWYGLRF